LFLASLAVLGAMSRGHIPTPYGTVAAAQAFYADNAATVRLTAFLQFGAAIPLAIFAAAVSSRLRFLGLNVAGVSIALCGGVLASAMLALCGLLSWTLSQPNVAAETGATHVLHLLTFATGGVGTAVPFGLLIAGIAISGGLSGLLPRWLWVSGVAIAAIAELAALALLAPQVSLLLPLARFPGLLWLIAAGFALPQTRRET
jgi:hypothetical protein